MAVTTHESHINNEREVTSKTLADSFPPCAWQKGITKPCLTTSTSASSKCTRASLYSDYKSPYLTVDKVHLLTKITEKKYIQKKAANFRSSFPLATNLYKASSYEFGKALTRGSKKSKKSVHTLSNVRAPTQKECTVSDMTESEYFSHNDVPRKLKPRTLKSKPKSSSKRRDLPYVHRDERYCSDINLNIYGSSTDTLGLEDIRTGQGKGAKDQGKGKENATIGSDVWAVLRSINKFQFRPTPCLSEEDTPPVKKKKGSNTLKYQGPGAKKRNIRKNTRLVESNCTEECVFVSTVDYYGKPPSSTLSPNMSADQITVINETDEFHKLCNKVKTKMIMNKTVRGDDSHQLNNTESNSANKKTKQIKVVKAVNVETANAKGDSLYSKRSKTVDNYLNRKPKSKNHKNVEILHNEIEDRPYLRGINISNNDFNLTINHFKSPRGERQLTNTYQADNIEYNQAESMNSMYSGSSKTPLKLNCCCSPKPQSSKSFRSATCQPRGIQKTRLKKTEVSMGDGECQIIIPSGSINKNRKPRLKSLLKKSKQASSKSPEVRNGVANKQATFAKEQVPIKAKESHKFVPNLSDEKEKHLAEWYNENEYAPKQNQIGKQKQKTSSLPVRPRNKSPESIIRSPKAFKFTGTRRASKTIMFTSEHSFITESEIKKRLAKLRYPIIILGKEQVNKGIRIKTGDPPQFNGLDKNIWPFMQTWYDIKAFDRKHEIRVVLPDAIVQCKTAKTKNNKTIVPKGNKHVHEDQKVINVTQMKKKPIHNLKDKMIKLFSAKKGFGEEFSPNQNVAKKFESKKKIQKFVEIVRNTDASTKTNVSFTQLADQMIFRISESTDQVEAPKKERHRRTWAQTKWASEFIENVMKKVKSGVYYSSETPIRYCSGPKNASIQTILTAMPLSNSDKNHDKGVLMTNVASEITFTGYNDPFKNITGFDLADENLEVKSLNMYEIAVKHKVTNVLVKFDVIFDTTALARHCQKPSYTPIAVTDNRTHIFKCKTTIFNHTLPAELCALIPDMMHTLLNPEDVLDPILPIITEMTASQSSQDLIQIPVLPLPRAITKMMSPKLRRLIHGIYENYSKIPLKGKTLCENVKSFKACGGEILPRLATSWLISYKNDLSLILPLQKEEPLQNYSSKLEPISNVINCTSLAAMNSNTLHSYVTLQNGINAMKKTINWSQMRDYFSNQNITKLDISTLYGPNNQISINVAMESANNVTKVIKIDFDGFGTTSNGFTDIESNEIHKAASENKGSHLKCIEFPVKPVETDVVKKHPSLMPLKANRRSYVKLYRKCKSTASILIEKTGTPLKKITSLDDFFEALGSAKTLSSVCDGGTAKVVMNSMLELQTWISDISPRQALLVLLLSNKKETKNLARVRPILLQAIAVNRITRASELDMEIEVILKEKICQPQASDYQKPFDETSEKLLKSLLTKRKQLNPSYLRVMARYVGLGLLKTPKN